MRQKRGVQSSIRLEAWENIAVDAVGDVIEFWGFKRSLGRLWALLYLHNQPLSAAQMREALGLSKGGVSMLLRDLEHWKVVSRERAKGAGGAWRYRAETDVVKMAKRVLEEREYVLLMRVCADFERAKAMAEEASSKKVERLGDMAALAEQTARLMQLLMRTPSLDIGSLFRAFASRILARGRKLVAG